MLIVVKIIIYFENYKAKHHAQQKVHSGAEACTQDRQCNNSSISTHLHVIKQCHQFTTCLHVIKLPLVLQLIIS